MLLPRFFRNGFLVAVMTVAAGCTMHIDTPAIDPMNPEPVLSEVRKEKLAEIDVGKAAAPLPRVYIPPMDTDVHLPRTGEKTAFGLPVTPELEKLWRAALDKDWQYWEDRLQDAARSLPDTPEARFFLLSLRIQTLIHAGRPDDVFVALKQFRDMEAELFGDNAETLSQYGQVHFWLGQPDTAIGYYTQLLADTGDWWIPGFFYGIPDNTATVTRIAKAMIRSYIGMAGAHVMKRDYKAAVHWGQRGLDRQQHAIGITQHPIFGLVVKADAHLYEGHAWLLTFLGAARVGMTGDLEGNRYILDAAKAWFRQSDYRWGDLVVDSITDYVLYDIGLKQQETARIGVLGHPAPVTDERLGSAIRVRPADLETREDMTLPVPAAHTISLPGAGDINSYNFKVGPALAKFNAAFLAGDFTRALDDLDAARAEAGDDPLRRWHISFTRARTLIAVGRAADAEIELDRTAGLEAAFFGSNLGSRALRAEARMALGDFDAAIRDALQVVEALGDFRAPTLFVFPPQIPQLALMNRAQFRSYLVIANALMFKGDYARARTWAEAAEQLFEESHYAWQHQLYSAYLKLDTDMFYGRGVNMAVIGAAQLQAGATPERAERTFASARAYLDAMGYSAGIAFVEAIRTRALLDSGHPAEAETAASTAAADAARRGLSGILWQLQALQGEALMALDRPVEAEAAYRAAQLGIEAVTGALSTDSARRRFGTGREDVTRALVGLDLRRGDLDAAFADLERGRARAFVDMLARRTVARGRQPELVGRIGDLSASIRRQRIINAAAGTGSAEGVATADRLLAERAALLVELRRRDPEMADVLSVAAPELASVRRALGADDLMLYALPQVDAAAPIRFLAITRRGAAVTEAALSPSELEAALVPFSTDRPLAAADAQRAAATRVTSGLGLDTDARKGVLYIVPTGPLYFVPWGALEVNRPVVMLPTGGWVTRGNPGRPARGAAIVGDPALGGEWAALPGARTEATGIGALYRTEGLYGAGATEAALRKAVGDGVGVLHLATHGLFDARDPLQSAILLSDGTGPAALTAERLFEQPLPAELVVLSACETGVGTSIAGDEFLGLARSFYLGGSRAVMNSLWPVHDKPTRAFMTEFHRQARNRDYGRAWLAARDSLRAQGLPPSVYGAFVLGGAARG
ncbi:MAG: CHAT domain-containing protein [Pseudomonadota bacterium]|nr:CHAT domain-containing protein [Pseudomonadota bacterium]